MITSFFRRWWMVRKLRKYIFKEGDITPIFGSTTTRLDRMRLGGNRDQFLEWLKWEWENWNHEIFAEQTARPDTFWGKLRFNLPWKKNKRQYFREWSMQTLHECVSLNYIEPLPNASNWIRLGHKGMEVYVWYYPVVAFFNLHYIKVVLTKILDWGIPIVLIYFFARFFHITTITISPQ